MITLKEYLKPALDNKKIFGSKFFELLMEYKKIEKENFIYFKNFFNLDEKYDEDIRLYLKNMELKTSNHLKRHLSYNKSEDDLNLLNIILEIVISIYISRIHIKTKENLLNLFKFETLYKFYQNRNIPYMHDNIYYGLNKDIINHLEIYFQYLSNAKDKKSFYHKITKPEPSMIYFHNLIVQPIIELFNSKNDSGLDDEQLELVLYYLNNREDYDFEYELNDKPLEMHLYLFHYFFDTIFYKNKKLNEWELTIPRFIRMFEICLNILDIKKEPITIENINKYLEFENLYQIYELWKDDKDFYKYQCAKSIKAHIECNLYIDINYKAEIKKSHDFILMKLNKIISEIGSDNFVYLMNNFYLLIKNY